jgi:hypothetical protein
VSGLGTTCEITLRQEQSHTCDNSVVDGWRVLKFAYQAAARELLPDWRIRHCLRHRTSAAHPVDVCHVPLHGSAHFGNLQTCGSVWVCAPCGSKVSERRRLELSEAIDRWQAGGGDVYMLTFTLQHHQGESCEYVLRGLLEAHSRFWRDRAGRQIARDMGIVGRVRGLEPTYGLNGWHNHLHDLTFHEPGLSGEEVYNYLGHYGPEQWGRVLAREGRFASVDRGFDVRDGYEEVADYVTKMGDWTMAHELAKAQVKKAGYGGRTPVQLLGDFLAGDDHAGNLFQEYAAAFRGRHQLEYSRGLRCTLGLGEELSDEELAQDEQGEVAAILARLGLLEWRQVLGNDIRGELLNVAAGGDWREVRSFLESFGICGVIYPGEGGE